MQHDDKSDSLDMPRILSRIANSVPTIEKVFFLREPPSIVISHRADRVTTRADPIRKARKSRYRTRLDPTRPVRFGAISDPDPTSGPGHDP